MGGLGFIFALLFLNLGVRLVFLVYCMATGRDEDEIVTRSISADSEPPNKDDGDAPADSPISER